MNQDQIALKLEEFGRGWDAIRPLPDAVKALEGNIVSLQKSVDDTRRSFIVRDEGDRVLRNGITVRGAAVLGAQVVSLLAQKEYANHVWPNEDQRKRIVGAATGCLQRWTGQTTTEFPLPTVYAGEIDRLVAEYGVVRNAMSPWPLSGGTDKPARQGTAMTFGSITMSSAFTEKNPTYGFADLSSHKLGSIVITPRELFEGSIVDIGMFLAEEAAIAFAKAEDTWGLLADATATYESISGVCKIAHGQALYAALSAGKTSPSDAGAADFRKVLGKVNSRVLNTGKWYLAPTWKSVLPDLNSEKNQYVYRETLQGDLLFGLPIVYTGVMQAYTTDAAASAYIALLADLRYWWFGKRPNGPRIDVSDQVLFDRDQIATRFIEEIDFDYKATTAAATLETPAA